MHQNRDSTSLGDLFADLTRELTTLVRQEIALASAELSHKASRLAENLGLLVLGAVVLYAGFLVLLAAAVIALAYVIEWWLSALIVGLLVAGVGYFLVRRGMSAIRQIDLAPRHTVATIKEDIAWAKEQTT